MQDLPPPPIAEWAEALAEARHLNLLARLPLHEIASRAAAEALQAEAVRALGRQTVGYKIGATSPEAQRLLQAPGPFYAPIFAEDMLESGAVAPLPAGLLGIECEFAFVMARVYPEVGERVERDALASAIRGCFCALELVGRRVEPGIPLNEASSIADFALNIALVRGAPILDWTGLDLTAIPVEAVVDGEVVAAGSGSAVLGHPLDALLWLARTLAARGEHLEEGHLVSTGTCTGITPLTSGQTFEGRFGEFAPVRVRLD